MRPSGFEVGILDRIHKVTGEALVSIYVPTHVRGGGLEQDPIRFKNGIARADEFLERAGWKPRERGERLSKAFELLDDREFWNHQEAGLGVFIDDEAELTAVALPGGAPQLSVLSHSFHLRPLVASIELIDLPVLVLTRNGVRLYRSSMHHIDRVDADLPKSFDDVNWFVDREKQRQQHPNKAAFKRSGHGHEGGSRQEDLARYLRAVAEAIAEPSGGNTLVVLGDDNLCDRFIRIAGQEAVSPANSGITDPDNTEEIHRLAGPTIAERSAEIVENMSETARFQLKTGDAITDLSQALIASAGGRAATLLIDADATPIWGSFGDLGEVSRHKSQVPFSVDLLDRLVAHAIGTGATVVNCPGPIEGHSFVAIPRY